MAALCACSYMWHDAPCFLLSARGMTWPPVSRSSERLPRRALLSLLYVGEREEGAGAAGDERGSDSRVSACSGEAVEAVDEADEPDEGCDS